MVKIDIPEQYIEFDVVINKEGERIKLMSDPGFKAKTLPDVGDTLELEYRDYSYNEHKYLLKVIGRKFKYFYNYSNISDPILECEEIK